MTDAKTARNMLHCDGCQTLIPTGGTYRIDAAGYLLCEQCASKGDLNRVVAV